MSAAEFIAELKAIPEADRERIFASLVENQQWREDILDLMTITARRTEPTRSVDEVFKDLHIDT
jgi:hypothetical protein